jgi:hypothetical protein
MDYANMPVIDPALYHWNWDAEVLSRVLSANTSIFLCGSADNQLTLHSRFDKVFVLVVEPAEQRRRIMARTSHDYGKHPVMQDIILARQQDFVIKAMENDGIAIDAMRPVADIVDDILRQTHAG